jgi:restriction system protein
MTAKEAAQRVLEEAGEPLHYDTITERMLEAGYWSTNGETPAATVNAQLAVSIQQKGDASSFQRVEPATYALRVWGLEEYHTPGRGDKRVKVPFYPSYGAVRAFLAVIDGEAEATLRTMRADIRSQSGTPQNPVEWSDPKSWIDERLSGESQRLAQKLWRETDEVVNPRYLEGIWSLSTNYELVSVGVDGILTVTDLGHSFVDREPETIQMIDEPEGVGHILTTLATKGRAQSSELLPEWSDYLNAHSDYTAKRSQKGTLRERLANLEDRSLVARDGYTYVITDQGLDYAAVFAEEEGGSPRQELQRALKEHNDTQRVVLRDRLAEMSPNDFEYLVRDLLEEMGYEDVEVTKQSGDKGVDVVATVQLGITEVKEVVQVKRYTNTVNRPKIDQLRGALHYHDAIRGTLITLSGFSQGCKDSAILPGAPPISLIDGERLLDLLIEHEIGIQRKPAVMYEVDGRYFDGAATD